MTDKKERFKPEPFPEFDLGDVKEPKPPSEIDKLKAEMQKIYQIIHNKGLEVGLPNVIVSDIAYIVAILDKMQNVWNDERSRQKEQEEDSEIEKKMNKGMEIIAYHDKTIQLLKMREQREKVNTFLWILKEKMTILQGRMIGKNIHDMER